MNLLNLLNEKILTEGRREDVMAKYNQVPKETVEYLSNEDPSGNNKYLEWMVRTWLDELMKPAGEDASSIAQVVKMYHEKQNLINQQNVTEFSTEQSDDLSDSSSIERIIKSPKDINSFLNLNDLNVFTKFLNSITSKKQELEELKKESDRIYEDKELIVLSPRTHRASCHYGKHSGWCVSTATSSHFFNYTKNGTLYFFISKIDKAYNNYWSDKDGGKPPYKTALLLKDDGDISWWSKGDSNYTDGWVGDPALPMLTQDIADRILKHNGSAIKNRKQREIDNILISKGFFKRSGGNTQAKNDFNGFVRSEIFTPEQVVSIIRNDNWLALYENSDTGKNVRKVLGTQVIYSLLKELLHTSGSDLSEVLKDINGQEFLSKETVNFSDEQNKEMAKMIVNKFGRKPTAAEVGDKNKMYVDKWTMTPEDWEKYASTSNYFLVGKIEPMEVGTDNNGEPIYKKSMNVEQITKVDRFNPADHHILQMMMLGARFKNLNLYAIVTQKNLLDEYVGGGTTGSSVPEIPESVMKTIMEKAKKIG